jgi:hypothetical protein
MLTDEQILESWNERNKAIGLPRIVRILPDKPMPTHSEDYPASQTDQCWDRKSRIRG